MKTNVNALKLSGIAKLTDMCVSDNGMTTTLHWKTDNFINHEVILGCFAMVDTLKIPTTLIRKVLDMHMTVVVSFEAELSYVGELFHGQTEECSASILHLGVDLTKLAVISIDGKSSDTELTESRAA